MQACLISDDMPEAKPECSFCAYRMGAYRLEMNQIAKDKRKSAQGGSSSGGKVELPKTPIEPKQGSML
jgi:hypothetical protein